MRRAPQTRVGARSKRELASTLQHGQDYEKQKNEEHSQVERGTQVNVTWDPGLGPETTTEGR